MEIELNDLITDLQSLNQSLPDPSFRDAFLKVIPLFFFFFSIIQLSMIQPILHAFFIVMKFKIKLIFYDNYIYL